jgi:hypothetical protein
MRWLLLLLRRLVLALQALQSAGTHRLCLLHQARRPRRAAQPLRHAIAWLLLLLLLWLLLCLLRGLRLRLLLLLLLL